MERSNSSGALVVLAGALPGKCYGLTLEKDSWSCFGKRHPLSARIQATNKGNFYGECVELSNHSPGGKSIYLFIKFQSLASWVVHNIKRKFDKGEQLRIRKKD